jgi:hypothetical protein
MKYEKEEVHFSLYHSPSSTYSPKNLLWTKYEKEEVQFSLYHWPGVNFPNRNLFYLLGAQDLNY